jgi:hypothetical protein
MKRLFYIIFLLGLFTKSFSQTNLVPNWSFEDTTTCPQPEGFTFYSYCPPWFSPNRGTPDFFNSCAPDSTVGVPYNCNGYGYQPAHTGNGYAGFNAIWSENAKEYLSVKLNETLKANKGYCISFYVNLANACYIAVDAIGAYLSVDSMFFYNYTTIHVLPQIENPDGNVIKDTLNWTLISGEYVAKGGEQYITIGDFKDDSLNVVDTIPTGSGAAYYNLDDVSVTLCDTTVGVNEIGKNKSNFNIYPNPVKDNFSIELSNPTGINDKMFVSIYTIQGQLLIQQLIKCVNTEVDVSMLAKGVYLVKVETSTNTTIKKLVKE